MRFARIVFAWLLFCSAAVAQVGQIPGWPPIQPVTGGSVPFSITFASTANNTTPATSFTFNAQGIGTADATRIVVVGVAVGLNTDVPSGVTIGGNAATHATGTNIPNSSGTSTDIWYLAVPAGTTANIVVTFSVSVNRMALSVYSVVGTGSSFSVGSGTALTIGAATVSATATVPAGGGAIAILSNHSSANAGLVTNGGNLTIDQNGVAFGNSVLAAGKNTSASGSTTFTFNWSGGSTDAAMSVVTFNP